MPCRSGESALDEGGIRALLVHVPAWHVDNNGSVVCLMRKFAFKDFKDGLVFVNLVGELAEVEDHHPEMTLAWGNVTVRWWTYSLGGLHRNDFIMAARTDELYSQLMR